MAKIYIVDLEGVDTRYTGQWKTHIPQLLQHHNHDVEVISGPEDIPAATSPGAFLNFGGTNIYKAAQVEKIGRLFCENRIAAGSHFLFTDAWHPGIINLKYMSELLKIPVKIHSLWHAGSYDPADFLGRLIGDAEWVRNAERSFYHASDHNYFASEFHIEMFIRNLLKENRWAVHIAEAVRDRKIIRTGWPFENLADIITTDAGTAGKTNSIVFPHRIAPEKQVNIFKDLANTLPQYEWIICQEKTLTKQQYHQTLARSKIVFSANLQETLGISCYEALTVNSIPMVPDRLSYKEMYPTEFKYPSEWTESFELYLKHKHKLVEKINHYMENFPSYSDVIKQAKAFLDDNYFSAKALINQLDLE